MITLTQLNEIPRPSWLSEYTAYPGMADFCAESHDVRRPSGELAVDVWDYTGPMCDRPCIMTYPAGRTFDEKIEFYQHAKAVAALLENPKARFYR